MPGVYRDPNGQTFSYQTNNDYEDRRRRALDDAYAGRPPFGPRAPDPRPPITWLPPAPAQVPLQGQIPGAQPQSAQDLEGIIDGFNLQIAIDAIETAENNALFDRLVAGLPNQVGESPRFDQLFDDPNTPVITAQELIAQLDI